MNVGGRMLATWLKVPLWADSFGTCLMAYIGGPVCGALVGLAGNLAYSGINHLSAAYALTSLALGIIVGIAAKRNWLDSFYGFMKTAYLAVFAALAVSVPLNLLLAGGYTGNVWGNGVVDYLLEKGWPPVLCSVLGQLAIEFADKVLCIAAVWLVILLRRFRRNRRLDRAARQGTAAVTALALCVSLGAFGWLVLRR